MSGKLKLPFAPTHLFYLMSLRCNERCTKCSHWKITDHPPMVAKELVLDTLRGIKSIQEFCIAGGEPLLYRDRILSFAEGVVDLPIRTIVITNGVSCPPLFVDQLRELNVHLVFSIDTLDPERWYWCRGTRRMDKVFRNLEYVRRTLRPEQLSIQSVLSNETSDDVAAVGAWCAERGIYQSIQPYVQDGFNGKWTPVADDEQPTSPCDRGAREPCLAAGRNLSILPDGTVVTCFQQDRIPGVGKPIGKLGVTPLRDMLESSYVSEVIARMRRCNQPCKVLRCNQ